MRLLFITLLFPILLLHTNPIFAETEANPLESQITSFMSGLEVDAPKQVVELWILGVKNRSGAVQYAMLSPSLRKHTLKKFEQRSWSTGQSSPWVDNFRLLKVNKISDTKIQYTIAYDLLTLYANFGEGQKVITVEKNPEPYRTNWFITKITTKYNELEAFTPAETVIKSG
ncbi:hypothetical protein [Bacillus atrophaeus]|uniref:hypothetical protein n=1 Tax=Bacillus atrophaeus TaxID=1452 RepID=UPI002DBCD54F|nr:hypothetical protein [Bacillus atrophaeus]MEC2307168.1 hypothetical protein [Bacillus atrophaeus]